MTWTTVTTIWTGSSGLPGYTRLKFLGQLTSAEAATAAGRVRAFWVSVSQRLPVNIQLQIQPDAQHYDNNGELAGLVTFAQPAVVAGAYALEYAAPVGAVINWVTSSVANGKKVRGRSFIVPLLSNSYQGDGTLSTSARTDLQNAATALVAGAVPMVIAGQEKTLGVPTGFVSAPVTAASVPDRCAILSSRRD